jgi:PTS system mannitol-specific IIA component
MADDADGPATAELLTTDAIVMGAQAATWEQAVQLVGDQLAGCGAVTAEYVGLMFDRERSMSTYVGEGVAIPHGTLAGRDAVRRDALAVVQFPAGVQWHDGNVVRLCVGIAACGEAHVPILAALAEVLMDDARAQALHRATTADEIHVLLTTVVEDDDE